MYVGLRAESGSGVVSESVLYTSWKTCDGREKASWVCERACVLLLDEDFEEKREASQLITVDNGDELRGSSGEWQARRPSRSLHSALGTLSEYSRHHRPARGNREVRNRRSGNVSLIRPLTQTLCVVEKVLHRLRITGALL